MQLLLGTIVLSALTLVNADVPELPAIPGDLSTPCQQRLAMRGATGAAFCHSLSRIQVYGANDATLMAYSHGGRLEHL
jgi:hypothetical protein